MTIRFPTPVRNAIMQAVSDAADSGTGNATLNIYSGGQPSSADNPATGTLLVTFTLTDPVFDAPSAGVLNLDADPDISAIAAATGSAGWARLISAAGTVVYDGTVGTSGDFVINSVSIVAGQTVMLASAALTYPA